MIIYNVLMCRYKTQTFFVSHLVVVYVSIYLLTNFFFVFYFSSFNFCLNQAKTVHDMYMLCIAVRRVLVQLIFFTILNIPIGLVVCFMTKLRQMNRFIRQDACYMPIVLQFSTIIILCWTVACEPVRTH